MILQENINIRKFRLSNFIISIIGNDIIASEYIYIRKESLIREISHPAEIDMNRQTLVIRMNHMHGSDTDYSEDDFLTFFSSLPEWNMTRYYQLYNMDGHHKYFSATNMLIKDSRFHYEIL